MKRITLFLALLLSTTTMMAEEFTLGKLTFATTSDTEVAVIRAKKDICSVDLTPSVTYQGVTYTITSIGDEAFYECSSLTTIIIHKYCAISQT